MLVIKKIIGFLYFLIILYIGKLYIYIYIYIYDALVFLIMMHADLKKTILNIIIWKLRCI